MFPPATSDSLSSFPTRAFDTKPRLTTIHTGMPGEGRHPRLGSSRQRKTWMSEPSPDMTV
jgi:hypothetical protein